MCSYQRIFYQLSTHVSSKKGADTLSEHLSRSWPVTPTLPLSAHTGAHTPDCVCVREDRDRGS